MKRNYRLAGYLLVATLLVGLMASGPQAWATPSQSSDAETVPTRTPKPQATVRPTDRPTVQPTDRPTEQPTDRPTEQPPPATPIPPTATPQPVVPTVSGTPVLQATATRINPILTPTAAAPTATPTASGPALSLAMRANPSRVWADQPVEYTLTLVNQSASPIRNVVLLDPLPTDLDPGAIISGAGTSWQDRTLRVEKGELAPGERLEIVFQVIVGAKLPPGAAIVNRASASAAGGLEASASTTIAMPPPELPRVGGIMHGER